MILEDVHELYEGGLGGASANLIKFLVVIRGDLTPPPRIDEPVRNIPLESSG
jgi:hypothetical protein